MASSQISSLLSSVTKRQFSLAYNSNRKAFLSLIQSASGMNGPRRITHLQPSSRWALLSSCFAASCVHAALVLPPSPRGIIGVAQSIPRNIFLQSRISLAPLSMVVRRGSLPPDFTLVDDDENNNNDRGDDDSVTDPIYRASDKADDGDGSTDTERRPCLSKRSSKTTNDSAVQEKQTAWKNSNKKSARLDGLSWMDRNKAFNNEKIGDDEDETADNSSSTGGTPKRNNRTFRQDFQGTRVFVKGIPSDSSWQDLKDHFAIAGNVVFASVSVDAVTGASKGVGIVQFETCDMAQNAIRTMRNYPLNGSVLYVREDVQEKHGGGGNQLKFSVPPQNWECADDENSSVLSGEEKDAVIGLIKARDGARRRRNYDASDQMRQELKEKFGVHFDDRLKQWWVSFDGSHVPQNIKAVKGEGRWGGKKSWRQIPTTPDNDASVNPDLVNGLLMQRDIARREKDFKTADALLDEARNSPDGNLYLRIHDESRTWRIWTDEPPPRAVRHSDDRMSAKSAAEQCIDLVREKAPHKEKEIKALLSKFPGREFPILKKLRKSLTDL